MRLSILFSMGTSMRGNLGGGGRHVPGPDVYKMKSSVGYQVKPSLGCRGSDPVSAGRVV